MAVDRFEPFIAQAQKRASKGDLVGALSAVDAALAAVRSARVLRARLLQALDRPREALDEVVALDRQAQSPTVLILRADLEEALDLVVEAERTVTRLLDLQPGTVALLARRALLRKSLGAFADAVADYDAALSRQPGDAELHRLRGEVVRARPGDGTIERLNALQARLPADGMPAVHLQFARAKALDDLGEHAASFEALLRANAGMRAHHPYDISTRLTLVAKARAAYGAITDETPAENADDAFGPVFVTGMPRSGTTLIEQIVSAHPLVTGGGETAVMANAIDAQFGKLDLMGPGDTDITPAGLGKLGRDYAARMAERLGPAQRVTDKSLQTLLYAGPVLAALPRARVVVVRRDPQATALSLFRQVFRPGRQLFSYALDDIAAYQRDFDDLVAFWAERLGPRFIVLDYEDVVTDPGTAIPALIDRLDLPWDPACLSPENNRRPVRTLSAVSVRAPINRDALDAWKPYAAMMAGPAPVA
ncbi:hypothetical protein HKCCE2091_15860 [Rhodobacterales bacterium HKCCE2091]|nr:hypothetical protein [Rhodobacterales bacterium HKCCE2091]